MNASQLVATMGFVRGSKREIRKGVWELRVSLGNGLVTGKLRQLSKTFHGGSRAADAALRDLVDQHKPQDG